MDFINWIVENYIWFFSGLGTTLIVVILSYKKATGSVNKVVQTKIIAKGDVVGRDRRGL
tara:strand:- start:7781 stop:7957 length:177 start_codon:yes stop_codon:yes gene_type:complete